MCNLLCGAIVDCDACLQSCDDSCDTVAEVIDDNLGLGIIPTAAPTLDIPSNFSGNFTTTTFDPNDTAPTPQPTSRSVIVIGMLPLLSQSCPLRGVM